MPFVGMVMQWCHIAREIHFGGFLWRIYFVHSFAPRVSQFHAPQNHNWKSLLRPPDECKMMTQVLFCFIGAINYYIDRLRCRLSKQLLFQTLMNFRLWFVRRNFPFEHQKYEQLLWTHMQKKIDQSMQPSSQVFPKKLWLNCKTKGNKILWHCPILGHRAAFAFSAATRRFPFLETSVKFSSTAPV